MSLVLKQAPSYKGQAYFQHDFIDIDPQQYQGKWVVLFYYPLDFTFVCPTEILAFSKIYSEFEKLGAAIIGASTDSVYSHMAWSAKPPSEGGIGQLNFPLLSDYSKSIAENFGILLPEGMAARASFIISPDNVVMFEMIHDNGIGRNPQEILRCLEALQYSAEHGVVCPANWEQGKMTMEADPEKSLDYFKKNYSK